MSAKALNYVKPLTEASNGEPITLSEKALLLYIADSHNEGQGAAWVSVLTMAKHMPGQSTLQDHATGEPLYNRMSKRRVREIIASLVSKGVLWREPRMSATGHRKSNYLRFTQLDGEPDFKTKTIEEKTQIRGRQAAEKSNASRRSRADINKQISTKDCAEGCEMPQGRMKGFASHECEISQQGRAKTRRDGCEDSHSDPNGTSLEPLIKPPVIRSTAACGNFLDEAKAAQRQLEQRRQSRSSLTPAEDALQIIEEELGMKRSG